MSNQSQDFERRKWGLCMKKVVLFIVLILCVSLSACSMQTPAVEGKMDSKEEANRLLEQDRLEAEATRAADAKQKAQEKLLEELKEAKRQELVLRDVARKRRKAEEDAKKAEEAKKAINT